MEGLQLNSITKFKEAVIAFTLRFLTSALPPAELTQARSLMIANALLFITAFMCFVGFVLNFYYFERLILAILDVVAVIVSIMAIIDLRRNHHLERAVAIGSVNLFFLFVAFTYTNQGEDFGLIWTIFFPVFVITLLGYKKGLMLTLFFYLVIFAMAYDGIGVWDEGKWNLRSFLRLVTASVVLTYIVYVYESILYHANAELKRKREQEANYIEELRLLSVTDPLTGLCNRRQMNEMLKQQVRAVGCPQQHFILIIFDIDNFKNINDRLGHNVGDQVLMLIAGIIKDVLNDQYPIARWGGEEFLILLSDITLNEGIHIAELLRQAIADAVYPSALHVTSSFGVAEYAPGADEYDLVNQADQALYQAKNAGKNRVVSYV